MNGIGWNQNTNEILQLIQECNFNELRDFLKGCGDERNGSFAFLLKQMQKYIKKNKTDNNHLKKSLTTKLKK